MSNAGSGQRGIRFSLRTLLLIVAMTAFALWAIPAAVEWYKWRDVRPRVDELFAELQLSAAEGSAKTFVSTYNGRTFWLSNRPLHKTSNGARAFGHEKHRTDAIFVLPPGGWAKTPDEAFRLIKRSE